MTAGSPQMNCGQPSLSPVNYSRQVNPKLTSSSTGTVHEYNRFAFSFENQDLQTVVDSAALMNIYSGVSNGNLAASEPAGITNKQNLNLSQKLAALASLFNFEAYQTIIFLCCNYIFKPYVFVVCYSTD